MARGCGLRQSNVRSSNVHYTHTYQVISVVIQLLTCVRHSEALYEDESFPERELAALVAAKVYYQLQEYNESMVFALGAGKLFDIHKAAEFEETILGKTLQSLLPVFRSCALSL
jgi:hypothetical protein